MPRPLQVGARRIYDRHAIDAAFDALGDEGNDFDEVKHWDEPLRAKAK